MLQSGDYHATECDDNREACRAYCSKDDTRVAGRGPYEYGSFGPGGQGRRNDLANAVELAKQGKRKHEIASSCPSTWVKYHRGLSSLVDELNPPSNTYAPKNVYILVGPTGVGKTRWAYTAFGNNLWRAPPTEEKTQWYDGYQGQKTALFDDFRGGISYQESLQLCDGYAMRVRIKGGFTLWQPDNIVFTSNHEPTTWWPVQDLSAFKRRVTLYRRWDDDLACWKNEWEQPEHHPDPVPTPAPIVEQDEASSPFDPELEHLLNEAWKRNNGLDNPNEPWIDLTQ